MIKEKPDYKNEIFNIAAYLPYMAELMPHKRAVVFPAGRDAAGRVTYSHLTFSQMNDECDRYADGLSKYGMGKGTKTLLMVKPSLEFITLTFALFKIGAVPILIDPGMGPMNMLKCISQVEPEAVIGIPVAQAVRAIFRWYFRKVKYNVTVGKRIFWGGLTLDKIREKGSVNYKMCETRGSDPAAILFTSGSTGPAKGVLYEHKMFGAQVSLLNEAYKFNENEMELPAFPLFALFNVALGITCVIPDMDPTKPASVKPENIVEGVLNQGITNTFGSPAIWNRVSNYCSSKNIKLNSIKRILIAGAPVSGELVGRVKKMLGDNADVHTPYGATESLPLCSISGNEICGETWAKTQKGEGICVGKPIKGIDARIIKITEEPLPRWEDALLKRTGEIGEIVVSGPVVTKEYYNNARATALSKIYDGSRTWHRMGDVGYLDDRGRLWFCGRKDHRVVSGEKIYFTIKCEAIFNNHPDVFRSALVGCGEKLYQQPVIVIELKDAKILKDENRVEKIRVELEKMGKDSELTKDIQNILFIEKMPVDIRHNAKIFREKLSVWAEGLIKKGSA